MYSRVEENLSPSFTTKFLFSKTEAGGAKSKNAVVGVVNRAIHLLTEEDGQLDEERRLQYTQAICGAIANKTSAIFKLIRLLYDEYKLSHTGTVEYGFDDLSLRSAARIGFTSRYLSENQDSCNALAAVAFTGDTSKLKDMLDRGINLPNKIPELSSLPFCALPVSVAAGQGQYDTLQLLLERGTCAS